LPALWILTKHSITWIIGCCFVSCLIMLPQLRDAWQHDCSRRPTGILTSTCMCDGNMQPRSHSVFKMVFGKAVFRFYIRDLIKCLHSTRIGCNVRGMFVNLLAYADDMVLLAPPWKALQCMLITLQSAAHIIKLSFNTKKTVCMMFKPECKRLVISESFPAFVLDDQELTFVSSFKYLGHIIDNSLNDDLDMSREIKCLFTRTHILIRRFGKCSVDVKKSYSELSVCASMM